MKKSAFLLLTATILLCSCLGQGGKVHDNSEITGDDSIATIEVKYATGFTVSDSADCRLVKIGKKEGTRAHQQHHLHDSTTTV